MEHKLKTLGLAILFVQISWVLAEDKKFQCKDHEISVTDKQIEGMKKCAGSVGVKSLEEMTPEKIPCFTKCIMETTGLVDDQGKPHKENILKDIDASVPEKMKAEYSTRVEKCIDAHGNNINPKDQTCLSYGPLAMCVAKTFKEVCQLQV